MKQYTVTFVVRATINRPDDEDEIDLPNARDHLDDYSIDWASIPEIIDVETIHERDLL
jgi:hypothetical protein